MRRVPANNNVSPSLDCVRGTVHVHTYTADRRCRRPTSVTSWQSSNRHGTTSCPTTKFLAVLAILEVSFTFRKERLPANQIIGICTKMRDGERPSQKWRRACGRPPNTWIHYICRDTGVIATEALQLAEDRPFWRKIASAEDFG